MKGKFTPNRGEIDRAMRDLGEFSRGRAAEFANVYPDAQVVQMQTVQDPEMIRTIVELQDPDLVSTELDQGNLMRRIDAMRIV